MTVASKTVALITGISSGMGKDFALRFVSEGYTVYGATRRVERMSGIEAVGGVVLGMLFLSRRVSSVPLTPPAIRHRPGNERARLAGLSSSFRRAAGCWSGRASKVAAISPRRAKVKV